MEIIAIAFGVVVCIFLGIIVASISLGVGFTIADFLESYITTWLEGLADTLEDKWHRWSGRNR